MKVISLLQPWATLLAIGAANGGKGLETRSKGCTFKKYRGPVLIHASKKFAKDQEMLCYQRPFVFALNQSGIFVMAALPLGAIIGSCEITGCELITKDNLPRYPEFFFGDYTLDEGRVFFMTQNNKLFETPISAKGQLGIWNWKPPEGVIL